MNSFKQSMATKVIAWLITICLVVTLIPDIGYAAEDPADEQVTNEAVTYDTAESETDPGTSEVPEEQASIADDPAMEGLTEDMVVDKTETTTTFDIGDGMEAVVFHGGAVRFENEEGELTDIDPTLVEIEEGEETASEEDLSGYSFRNAEGEMLQYFPEKLAENTPVLMEYEDYRISIIPTDDTAKDLGLLRAPAQLEEETLPSLYEGKGESVPLDAVYGSEEDAASFTYTSGENGIKETLVLNERPDTNVFTFDLKVGDLIIKENVTDEGITLIDPETDAIVAAIEAPWMNDAAGDSYSEDISYSLEKVAYEEGRYTLVMTVDEEYLSDEERVYPVTIDPTVTWRGNDELRDVYVINSSTYADINFYDSGTTKMPVGKNSTGLHRTYISPQGLKAKISGKSVESAKLTVYETGTGAANQKIRMNRVTSNWTASTLTWNDQPTWNTAAYTDQVTTTGTQYKALTFNCTAFAKNIAGDVPNYGLILRNVTDTTGYASLYGSRHSSSAYRPKLVVTYHDKPTRWSSMKTRKYTDSGYIDSQHFKKEQQVYVSWTGIKSYDLAAVQYRILGHDGTADPKSVSSDNVDLTVFRSIGNYGESYSNRWVSWTKYLPEGKYRLSLRGKDRAGNTGPAYYKVFTVDGTEPSLTSVKVTPATSSSSLTTDLTPKISWNATDDHFSKVTVKVGKNSAVTTTTSSGSRSYTVPKGKIKKSGTIDIVVTAYDKAGNSKSVTKKYYVDIAAPSITELKLAPSTTVSAPKNSRTPKLSWQIKEQDLASVKVSVDGKNVAAPSVTATSVTLPQSAFTEEGIHTVKITAKDGSGNASSKTINYHLDTTAPVIEDVTTDPETGIFTTSGNRSPKLTWDVTEKYGYTVKYSLDGENWTDTNTGSQGYFTLPSSLWPSEEGNFDIYVKAVDKAGNESQVETVTYRLNNTGNSQPQQISAAEYYGKRHISWNLDAYDGEMFRTDIHRSTEAGFTPSEETVIATDINGAEGLYIDNEVLEEGTYYYKVTLTEREGEEPAVITSDAVSITNSLTEEDLKNTLGNKDYLSYTSVELPTGTAYIEESSGNLMFEQDDFDVSNPQLSYGMSRTYNSQNQMTGMLGKGWTDSYHKELYRAGNDIYFMDSDGSVLKYEKDEGADEYSCAETKEYALSKTEEGFTLTTKDDIVYTFNIYGQLISTAEPNGCMIKNLYEEGKIVKIESTSVGTDPEYLDLEYEENSMFLEQIKDPVETTYSYCYMEGKLSDVTVLGKSNGRVDHCYDYNENGVLSEIDDGKGNPYTFVYAEGKVTEAGYPDNEKLRFEYDLHETDIIKITPDGDTVFTETTGFEPVTGKLLYHTDPAGDMTVYSYMEDKPFLVESETTAKGYETIEGNTVTIHSQQQTSITSYGYNEDEDLVTETAPDGSVTTYSYNENLLISETTVNEGETISEEHFQYDEKGNMESCFDAVADTQSIYVIDEAGNETAVIELAQVETENEVTDLDLSAYENPDLDVVEDTDDLALEANGVKVSDELTGFDEDGEPAVSVNVTEDIRTASETLYDKMGREISSTENGVTTLTEYDFLGRAVKTTVKEEGKDDIVTTMSYDENGSLISESVTGGPSKTYSYDSRNRNTSESVSGNGIETRTRTTVYSYEKDVSVNDGRSTRTEDICYFETVKDTDGNPVSTTYMDKAGNTVKEVAGSTFTDYTYDRSGNQIVSYTGATGTSEHQISLSLYDQDGNNFANISQPEVSGGDYVIGTGSITTYSTFDVKGNLTSEKDGEGIETVYGYDDENRVVSVEIAPGSQSEGSSDESASTDEEGTASSGHKNDMDVIYTETDDITTTEMIDGNGHSKVETVNAAGLTTDIADIGGDAGDIRRSYEYDDLGRRTKETLSDGGYIEYFYQGSSSRVLTRKAYEKTAEGNEESSYTLESEVLYTYNGLGQIEKIETKDKDGNVTVTKEYTYDCEGKTLTEKVKYGDESSETIRYSYDKEGRLVSKEYPSDTGLGTVNYSYDVFGRCTEISQGDDAVREYFYDQFGRVSKIRNFDEPGSTSYMETAYSYDSHGRADSMVTTAEGNAENILESFTYEFDKNGYITEMTHVNDLPAAEKKINETRSYIYDDHGNLIKSTKTDHKDQDAQETVEYEYDPVGNRTAMTDAGIQTTYTYNSLNQLKQAETGTTVIDYDYDQNGNQVKETTSIKSGEEEEPVVTGTVTMDYAVTGEMTELIKIEDEVTTLTQQNTYDHNGIRISRTENGTTRDYYYDNGTVAFTKDGETITSANILAENGAAVGTYRGDTYYGYLKDIQGSTTNIIKNDGSLSAVYDYSDFGETEEITGSDFDNQICYTGGIYDESTELYYLNARYYDPATGRFISQDTYRGTVDDPGQWHLYVYCANNPINYVDPSGHAKVRHYTRSQSYNTYLLIKAIDWTIYVIGVVSCGASFFVYSIGRILALTTFAISTAYGISTNLNKSVYSRLKSGFYKAGTKPRKGCKVTFYSIFNFKFKYKY